MILEAGEATILPVPGGLRAVEASGALREVVVLGAPALNLRRELLLTKTSVGGAARLQHPLQRR